MLLGVAASMFGSQGYAATSVSQLARKVGLSKPGFYHHVKGKKELLYEICHFSMTHLLMGAREALELSDDPVGQISDVIKRHGSFYREHSDKLASLRQARFLAPPQRREIYGMQRDYLDVVRTILRDGQRQKVFRAVNPTVAAFSLFAILNSPATWYDPYGGLSWDDVMDEIRGFCLHGLKVADEHVRAETNSASDKPWPRRVRTAKRSAIKNPFDLH